VWVPTLRDDDDGVDDEIISADYAMTAERMDELVARHRARAAEAGDVAEVAESLFAAEASVMRAVLERLRSEHTSGTGYLVHHGLEPGVVESLRRSLLE